MATFRKKLMQMNIFHIFIDGLFSSVPILLSFMIVAFGGGEKDVGIIIALGVLAGTVVGLSTTSIVEYFGLLRTVGVIVLFFGIGFFANAFSQNAYFTGFFFVLAVAGSALFHNATFSYIAINSETKKLTKTLSDFTALGEIGRIPLVSLAGFIAALTLFDISGWRIVCAIYGISGMLLAVYIFYLASTPDNYEEPKRIIRTKLLKIVTLNRYNGHTNPHQENYNQLLTVENEEDETAKGPKAQSRKRKKSIFPSFTLLKNCSFALAVLSNAFNAFCGNQVFAFLPLLLFAKGVHSTIIGSFIFCFTVGCFIGKIVFGRISCIWGTRPIFVVAECITAIMLVILIFTSNLIAIIIIALCLGIVTKGTAPVVQTIITEPIKEKGFYNDIFAINGFIRGIMNIIAPLLFGFIAEIFTIDWAYLLMAIAALASIVPILCMEKMAPEQPEPTCLG